MQGVSIRWNGLCLEDLLHSLWHCGLSAQQHAAALRSLWHCECCVCTVCRSSAPSISHLTIAQACSSCSVRSALSAVAALLCLCRAAAYAAALEGHGGSGLEAMFLQPGSRRASATGAAPVRGTGGGPRPSGDDGSGRLSAEPSAAATRQQQAENSNENASPPAARRQAAGPSSSSSGRPADWHSYDERPAQAKGAYNFQNADETTLPTTIRGGGGGAVAVRASQSRAASDAGPAPPGFPAGMQQMPAIATASSSWITVLGTRAAVELPRLHYLLLIPPLPTCRPASTRGAIYCRRQGCWPAGGPSGGVPGPRRLQPHLAAAGGSAGKGGYRPRGRAAEWQQRRCVQLEYTWWADRVEHAGLGRAFPSCVSYRHIGLPVQDLPSWTGSELRAA